MPTAQSREVIDGYIEQTFKGGPLSNWRKRPNLLARGPELFSPSRFRFVLRCELKLECGN